jgi:hypothetical protein
MFHEASAWPMIETSIWYFENKLRSSCIWPMNESHHLAGCRICEFEIRWYGDKRRFVCESLLGYCRHKIIIGTRDIKAI